MIYLRLTEGQLTIETGELTLATLRHAIGGGFFELPWAYDGLEPEHSIAMAIAQEHSVLPATAFVPELLRIVQGPIVLVGFDAVGEFRSLEPEELSAFQLVAIDGTEIPRLVYHRPGASQKT